jgi:hypothetical protein
MRMAARPESLTAADVMSVSGVADLLHVPKSTVADRACRSAGTASMSASRSKRCCCMRRSAERDHRTELIRLRCIIFLSSEYAQINKNRNSPGA